MCMRNNYKIQRCKRGYEGWTRPGGQTLELGARRGGPTPAPGKNTAPTSALGWGRLHCRCRQRRDWWLPQCTGSQCHPCSTGTIGFRWGASISRRLWCCVMIIGLSGSPHRKSTPSNQLLTKPSRISLGIHANRNLPTPATTSRTSHLSRIKLNGWSTAQLIGGKTLPARRAG